MVNRFKQQKDNLSFIIQLLMSSIQEVIKKIQENLKTDPKQSIELCDQQLQTVDKSKAVGFNLYLLKAVACQQLKPPDYKLAAESAEQATKAQGINDAQMANAYQQWATALQQSKEFAAAAQIYEQIYEKYPSERKKVALLYNLGNCYQNQSPPNFELSIKYLREAIDNKDPNDKSDTVLKATVQIAKWFLEQNKFDESIRYYDQAIDLAQNQPDLLIQLLANQGGAYQNAKIFEKAEENFKKVLEKKPDDPKANEGLRAMAYNRMVNASKNKQYAQALGYAEEVIKRAPDDVEAWFCKALSLENTGKIDDAIQAYLETYKRQPDRVDALINLGALYHAKRQFDLSIEYNLKAAKFEERASIFSNLGEAYKEQGKPGEALAAFDKAISLDAKNVLSRCNRAQLYMKISEKHKAVEDLKEVEKLIQDPNNTKDLKEGSLAYIKTSVRQILEMERAFQKEKEDLERKLRERDQSNPLVQEMFAKLDEMQKKKDEQAQQALNQVSSNQPNAKIDMISVQELQLEFQKMMQQLNDFDKQKEELQQEIVKEDKKIEEIKKEVDEQEEMLKLVGADKAAKVKTTYREWSDPQHPNFFQDGYDYAKAFYWTFINYCDAQRIASTGVVQRDDSYAMSDTTKTAVSVASTVLGAGESLPFVGSIFKVLSDAVQGVYAVYEEKAAEDKRNSIIKLIQENGDADTQKEWSMLVALAAQEIARRKKGVFIQIRIDKQKAQDAPKGTLSKMKEWILASVEKMKAATFQMAGIQDVSMYDTVGGEEACADIILVLAFVEKNFAELIKNRSQTLDITIADIVYLPNGQASPEFLELLNRVEEREALENPNKKQTSQTDQSCTCNLI